MAKSPKMVNLSTNTLPKLKPSPTGAASAALNRKADATIAKLLAPKPVR